MIFPSCWQSAWLQGHIEGQHFLCFRKSTICAVSVSLRGHTPVQRFVCQVVVFTNGQSTTKRFFWFAHFVPFPTHWVPPYSSFCLAQISICLSIWVFLGTFNFLTRMHLIQLNFYICYQKSSPIWFRIRLYTSCTFKMTPLHVLEWLSHSCIYLSRIRGSSSVLIPIKDKIIQVNDRGKHHETQKKTPKRLTHLANFTPCIFNP